MKVSGSSFRVLRSSQCIVSGFYFFIHWIICSSLAKDEVVDWSNYNVYTVANVAKRFLLSIPGAILGENNELRILDSALPPIGTLQSHTTITSTTSTTATEHRLSRILDNLPPPCRELAVIIFGLLHSMVRHAGFEVATGCHSCSPSTPSQTSSSLLRAPKSSTPTAPPPLSPI
ncbi:hypothetical protein Aperf_G00000121976 [Anoplocephala perfoliata]